MLLRMVQAKARPGKANDLRTVYDSEIIPTLQETPGCLFACLIQGTDRPDEVASLTLWESQEDADTYTRAGTYDRLMKHVRPLLAESNELKTVLSPDLKLEASDAEDDPEVSSYPVSIDFPAAQRGIRPESSLYLRIVSVALKPDYKDEFYSLYIQRIIPALQDAPGCLHAYLIMPSRGTHKALSLTMWESRKYAEAYETWGQFSRLISEVKHTFTDLIQWKLQLDTTEQARAAVGDEIGIQHYSVLTLRDFGDPR